MAQKGNYTQKRVSVGYARDFPLLRALHVERGAAHTCLLMHALSSLLGGVKKHQIRVLRHRLRGPTRIARARSPLRYLGQLVCRGRSCRARPTSNRHPAQQWLCSLHRSGLAAHTAADVWCEMHRSRAHHASVAHQYSRHTTAVVHL